MARRKTIKSTPAAQQEPVIELGVVDDTDTYEAKVAYYDAKMGEAWVNIGGYGYITPYQKIKAGAKIAVVVKGKPGDKNFEIVKAV